MKKRYGVEIRGGDLAGKHYFDSWEERQGLIDRAFGDDPSHKAVAYRSYRRDGGTWLWDGDGFTAGALPEVKEHGFDAVLP